MRIVIGYPPLDSKKGIPFLAQNRQFQWGNDPWNAYPMIPASAATLLKNAGHEVFWLDGITQGWNFKKWLEEVKKVNPDLIIMETKTPVIKQHWKIIKSIKYQVSSIKVVLVGDHVTSLPQESFENSAVDYVLTGGDYDFLLLNLANHLAKGKKLEPGIWYRLKDTSEVKNTGKFQLNHDLNKLPFIDRDLTRWWLYAYKNSNYSRTPGTYTMFGRDCWWGRCSFCSWTILYSSRQYRVMSVKRALNEIGYILDNYPVKEIMDDSGTFPVGDWLREFCQGMIKRGYNQKIKFNCNMRFNVGLIQKDYDLMAKAGFRFLLYGLESANQKTLDRLNKNLKVTLIPKVLKMAKKAGLWPHITVMVGYPWEKEKDISQTLNFVHQLFKKGLVDTLQATIVIPYPGTPLFEESEKKGWLKTKDWQKYDMKEPIMKTEMTDEEIMACAQDFYSAFWSLQFVWRKLKEALVDKDKFKHYFWLGWKYFSKKADFSQR